MKKLALTLFAIGIVATIATAQPTQSVLEISEKNSISEQAVSTSALNYRLTALRSYNMNGGVWEGGDSLALEYSGTRGSDIMNDVLDYDSFTNFDWDGFIYTPYNRAIRTYNGNDQMTEEVSQIFNGATWDDNSRILVTYNGNGQMASETHQDYNAGVWDDDTRYVYAYNNGRVAGRTNQDWNGSSWENDWRYVYTYDGSGNQTSRVDQNWNGSSWEDQSRNVYNYDGNGNQLQDLRQTWSGSAWEDSWRYNMQYDAEGWLTSRTRQSWTGSTWEDDWRNIYSHNSGDYYYNEVTRQDYTGSTWENDFKEEYTFTSFNKIAEYISYNWDGALWAGSLKQIVYYEQYDDGTTGMEPTVDLGVKVYPNPAAEYVMFKSDGSDRTMHVEVYNMQGSLVGRISGSGNTKWYTDNNVASGMYNYVITIGDKKQSGQVIVR